MNKTEGIKLVQTLLGYAITENASTESIEYLKLALDSFHKLLAIEEVCLKYQMDIDGLIDEDDAYMEIENIIDIDTLLKERGKQHE